jgi:hypothetical protein
MNFRELFRSLVPGLEGGSAEVDAVDEELQGFGVEFDATLAGFARSGPAEAAFFEAFCRDPEAGAVEVEELDSVAAFVGEDEEGVAGGMVDWSSSRSERPSLN